MSRSIHVGPNVLVFDVNETLLDIEVLQPLFLRLYGDAGVMREWFAQLILYSQVLSLAGIYKPFGELGAGVLRMVGQTRQIAIAVSDIYELRSLMRDMAPHPEVAGALDQLQQAGFRMVTLTNSAADPAGGPLERSGLGRFFERSFSVDEVKRFKPAPETYRCVASALQIEMAEICLVAAHTWDTLGAQALGCFAALVARPGNAVLPIEGLPQPDIIAPDMKGVAEEIVRRWR